MNPIHNIFDASIWASVPFHFWTLVFFSFGCVVGSFLNVVIHRLPLGQSIVSPPSHCPHCRYSIPWYLNVPLITWLYLRGRCRNCGAPISIRYFLVELLTGVAFASCWLAFGASSPVVALSFCLFLALLIAGAFIDAEHLIIPDEITFGGIGAGLLLSTVFPQLQGQQTWLAGLAQSALGAAMGAGIIYAAVRLGKLVFGRYKIAFPTETKVVFTESYLHLPDQDIEYGDLLYRRSDAIALRARTVELADRCYRDVVVRLFRHTLQIGDEDFNPEDVPHLEATTTEVVLPREAMGFGDVKLMAAVGAFLGWSSVFFSLMASSVLGTIVGLPLLLARRKESPRLAYVPLISIAAVIWMFLPESIHHWWTMNLRIAAHIFFRLPLPPEAGVM